MSSFPIGQKSEYTFKHNVSRGRHGWLRLTPAYSVRVVEEIIERRGESKKILEPFSGTATTPLCAAYAGHEAVAIELNPFLVWLGRAKTRNYSGSDIACARDKAETILVQLEKGDCQPCQPPPMFNIERWWGKNELDFLCSLMGCLRDHLPQDGKPKNLLLIAFCRLMIRISNAAFNHQSMSFKSDAEADRGQMSFLETSPLFPDLFREDLRVVLASAAANPVCEASIIEGDSRETQKYFQERFDLLITSPPYPNRMSYIRELRPYLYWLGYLNDAREAGELDWQAIGGTWGIATSRLQEWHRDPIGYYPNYFIEVLDKIAHADNKSGQLLSNYVAKYFEDMWRHFQSILKVAADKAEVHYIVGNSVFYGITVPVQQLYSDMFHELGMNKVCITTLRKRNSKKELLEFDISGNTP